jgi:hypothetical protein
MIMSINSKHDVLMLKHHPYLTFSPTTLFLPSKIIYLFIPSPTHKHETIKGCKILTKNNLDQSMYMANQE